MHAWTKSACVGLAWGILTIVIVVAAGLMGPVRPAQANTRIASSTTQVTLASTPGAAAAPGRAAGPAARYVVQPGDTLSGIAARFAVRGGWPALYAANRPLIGPDPDLIRPGTVLVLPGRRAPARYRVVPGDTLAAIAAALAVRGGWPALYAANRRVIGPNPNLIRAGTVLTVPQPAASGPAPRRSPAPSPSAPTGRGHRPRPGATAAPGGTAVPSWLTALLLAAGLLIAAALLAGRALLTRRRRQQTTTRATPDTADVSRQRSHGVAAAARPVAVAARVHPAGVAVPCAVLAAGIVLFTYVESATIRVVPPGGSGHHRVQPGQPGPPALPGGPGGMARPAARYAVQPGDTLSGIAARFAVRGGWPALYAANRDVIGPDPNLIRAGTLLAVPWSAAPSAAAAGVPQWLKTVLAADQTRSSAATAVAGSRGADR